MNHRFLVLIFLTIIITYACSVKESIYFNDNTAILFLEKKSNSSAFEGKLITYDLKAKKAYNSNMAFWESSTPKISPDKKYLIFNEYEYYNEHLFVFYNLDSNKVSKSIKPGIKNNHIMKRYFMGFDFLNDSILVFNDNKNLYTLNSKNNKTSRLEAFKGIITGFSINQVHNIISLCLNTEDEIYGNSELHFYNLENKTITKSGYYAKRLSNWSLDGNKMIFSANNVKIYNYEEGIIDSTSLSKYEFKDQFCFLDNDNILINYKNQKSDNIFNQLYIMNLSKKTVHKIYENNTSINVLQTYFIK